MRFYPTGLGKERFILGYLFFWTESGLADGTTIERRCDNRDFGLSASASLVNGDVRYSERL